MEDHKQSERVRIESPKFWIIYVVCFCPFLYLQKLEEYIRYEHFPFRKQILISNNNVPVKPYRGSVYLSHWSRTRV